MAFHFSLESVLRFRQSLEDRELLRLQALLSQRSALLGEVQRLRKTRSHLRQAISQAMLLQPTPAVEIHFATARLDALERQQEVHQGQLDELQETIAEQRSRYQQQRRNREMLEALRETQWRDYQLIERRREQRHMDELHLLRLVSRKQSHLA
jgi:flagellar export protein FliJ